MKGHPHWPLQVLHTSHAVVEMSEPYLPGFLAFREVGFLLDRLEEVHRQQPHLSPQVCRSLFNVFIHVHTYVCSFPCRDPAPIRHTVRCT